MTAIPPASAAPDGAGRPVERAFRPEAKAGPEVARLFQKLFAVVLGLAWWSLGRQVLVLVGERGLVPAGKTLERAALEGLGFSDMPTVFWLSASDRWLVGGITVGMLLAVLALFGLGTRVCFALSALLYLSFTEVCDEFLYFQWDNMLVEVAVLAAFLPADRPAPFAHFAFRVLLFKLYFESGIAKWQSFLGDWQDGSAMTFYYETAPIPTRLAWYAHHLPERWHHYESWGALVLELLISWLVWGPRSARLVAFVAFTGFQVMNTLTANYGFFTYLSLLLGVFLLSDRDVTRVLVRLRALGPRWLGESAPVSAGRAVGAGLGRLRVVTAVLLTILYLGASLVAGLVSLSRSGEVRAMLGGAHAMLRPYRVANVYHLFGHITRERIEPEFQSSNGDTWTAHDLRYKPGHPSRAPPFVAPHQPRVDFRLWFYGLSYRRGMPLYVDTVLARMCTDPEAVQPLFAERLSPAPDSVRVVLYRYRFSSRERRADTGDWWTREIVMTQAPLRCAP